MSINNVYWKADNTPQELHSMLSALADEYPVSEGTGKGVNITFIPTGKAGTCAVEINGNSATVSYNQVCQAARGVGAVMAGIAADEKIAYKTLGIMLDCSRNAVMKVSHLKKWLRRLALMGYNMAQLYTEDTYKLPDEPFFGYLRGAYTMDEMKEVDAYATTLGIEMIACIQTLGHLQQILEWSYYSDLRDSIRVMMVDESKTYKLIDKMLAFWSEAFSSRRIHIGMDETHDLGRGSFMDKFGYERSFDIFNRHLNKVNNICTKYKLNPMIWSDMYFRMGNDTNEYYREDTVIPDDVKAAIPPNVALVYWNYNHKDPDSFRDWIKRHRALGFEPIMGSGVQTWRRMWYDPKAVRATVRPCLDACATEKLDEVFFTLWGDDGAYCEFDSALAGLCYAAELAYRSEENIDILEQRFRVICDASYAAYVRAGDLQLSAGLQEDISAANLLWDDPLYGIVEKDYKCQDCNVIPKLLSGYKVLKCDLESNLGVGSGNLIHAVRIADAIIAKLEFREELLNAYSANDISVLNNIRGEAVANVIEKVQIFHDSLREQWMLRNKPFGFESLQLRLNGLIGRYKEIATRLGELLDGTIESIPELDEVIITEHTGIIVSYQVVAVPSFII
ncbi:MAG: beta-N-acetylhexosaminidase [Victivallaceae bacterium]|nr:beta-N-acetylhexosaminidase [Victivallaceae bacterium]